MSKSLFQRIQDDLEHFPGLVFDRKNAVIKGTYDLKNTTTQVVLETHTLSIFLPRGVFTTRLPKVTETSSLVPRDLDRHVYESGLFCLTSKLYEYIICKKGITFKQFMETIVHPFLATQLLISTGKLDAFPQGEYAHGGPGILQSYMDYLHLDDSYETLGLLVAYTSKLGRNKLCFCGSGRKYKVCHLKVLHDYPLPHPHLIKQDLNTIIESPTHKDMIERFVSDCSKFTDEESASN